MTEEKTLIHQNILTMFQYRGYTDIDDDSPEYITAVSSSGQTVYAFKEIFGNLHTKNFNEIIAVLNELDPSESKHGIIVYTGTSTPQVNKATLPTAKDVNIRVEMFQHLDLLYLCVHHCLVPPHRKLTPEDAKSFREKYSTQIGGKVKLKIPLMFSSDAIAKFYDFRPGDIIQIDRKNELPGFRLVVKKN